MAKLSVGSEFPKGVEFKYIPFTKEAAGITACGVPTTLDLDKELAGKKIVIVAVPGAFTPTCMINHIPPFGEKLDELKKKGVDDVIVISANDPYVLSAWGKALKLDHKLKLASDPNAAFSVANDLSLDGTALGLGIRTWRYLMIVENGKISLLNIEPDPTKVTNTGVDAALAAL